MKQEVLIFDINCVPDGMTLEQAIRLYKEGTTLLYDSKKDEKPSIVEIDITLPFIYMEVL